MRVRQAINHAVDVDKIIKFILNGQAVRAATLYGRQTAGFDPEVKPYEYNPQRAKELLTQAGFATGFSIGMDAPIGGNPIKPVEVAQAVAADLEKVGIKPQLRTLDTATYAQMKFGYKLAPILMWNWMALRPTTSSTRRRTPRPSSSTTLGTRRRWIGSWSSSARS